ncbi:MAG: hypothetical protein NVS9B7_09390 [Flavisolibacter sp.]
MDNTYQLNSAGNFNLKAYGLVVYLLNKNVKIKWVITAGKIKDGIDISSVKSDQVKPSTTATLLQRDFKAGPFVIFQPDTTGVSAMVDAYYTSQSLTGADRPNMYINKSMGGIWVDIRYNLTGYVPQGAILIDGGNQAIHLGYMVAAGIPTTNYTTSTGDNLTNCFGFASEPHNTATGTAVDTTIINIKNFVQIGGNFLAQCAAVSNYENNPLGRFQTTTGITVPNANIGSGAALTYPNPDLAYSQFEGDYFSYDGVSVVQNWLIPGLGINNEHNHGAGTGVYSTYKFATAAKLKAGLGGMVFYLNCHDFMASVQPLTINGIRMYMNAFLTPSAFLCNPLPLHLLNFAGKISNGRARFDWNTADNETGDHFELEFSSNGRSFNQIAAIACTIKEGLEAYTYTDKNIFSGKAFYRLKMVNKNHSISYSRVVMIDDGTKKDEKLVILENPVNSDLTFKYNASVNEIAWVSLYNTSGLKVFTRRLLVNEGANSASFPIPNNIATGTYLLEVTSNAERQVAKIIKK